MSVTRFRSLLASALLCCVALTPAAAYATALDNAGCLSCHESKKPKIEVVGKDDEARALAHVDQRKYGKGIHGEMQCVACHTDIVDSQAHHRKPAGVKPPDCVTCHEALWAEVQKSGQATARERLGLVVKNIEAYRSSFHARPDTDNPDRPKASCEDCHSSHSFNVPPVGSERRTAWHKEIPDTCGAKCHEDQLEDYAASIHGEEVLDNGNTRSAVCTDCHSAHNVINTSSETFKLANVNTCGTCHKPELASYTDTYHGQVNRLGYAYTAKCADCHGSHGIRAVEDPKSSVHPDRRMKTCMKCHSDKKPGMHDATPGFASFGPHANAHDFEKYPQMVIASKFMVGLLIFVFAFFWAHSGLWYYREPRPQFERWAYYEKFDYWAVFWGVNIIGWSGLMLAFPHVTATYLPGWVFNVATLVHGEEAFLAAVFLFTVHFFNNHFRPDKLPPPDVVMFTGTQSLDEFRHDHPAHFQRMLDSGELQKHLVEAPSKPFHTGSVILGLTLIAIGLVLLVLVGVGFFSG